MVNVKPFNTGRGSVSVKVTTHPRQINFKGHIHNITVAGEDIVRKYSESLLRGVKYRYKSRAKREGKNIRKQFKRIRVSKTGRYSYVGGLELKKQAARWFGLIESGNWKPHWIPYDYINQHNADPGVKGKKINARINNEVLRFVWVKPNLRLKNLFRDTVNKKFNDFNRTLVRMQKQAIKKAK